MRKKCRIWWPKDFSVSKNAISESFVFGWFVSSSSPDSIDAVVAFLSSEDSLADSKFGLEEIIHGSNEKMPVSLQDKSRFSLLGHCSAIISNNGQLSRVVMEEVDDKLKSSNSENDGLQDQSWRNSMGSNWIQLLCHSHEKFGRETFSIPKLHQIRWNGQIVSQCDVHFVLYESPTYGSHHFSLLRFRSSYEQEKAPLRKPKWVEELHQKQTLCDMDTIILAINSATAAKVLFHKKTNPERFFQRVFAFVWYLFAISVASLSTVLYVILQSLYKLSGHVSRSWMYIIPTKVFNTVVLNIQIRCSQILYWPVFLEDRGIRFQSCVEYEEKSVLRRHFMWSSIATDVIFGNLIGFPLLCCAESVCSWVLNFVDDVTNVLLRSGCVWLMGVPAGFKLNTELAGVIGMLSLIAIQIWSTLWVLVGFYFIFFIKALAILGIVFGATLPAALVIDFIALATLHVSTIHCFVAILYSTQIQAIASLWRLFRGQKWNPFRQRLDSYDYTVKQHVVGSLLFTPLLLLLPTTSVFYIFFSILDTTINLIRMLIGLMISVIHVTPFAKIFLRLVRPRRFPSGIWFDIVFFRDDADDSSNGENMRSKKDTSEGNYSLMVSVLRSNFMTLRQVVNPHYKNAFSGISRSSFAASAYGILTGKGIGSTFVTCLPSPMPWMFIPYKEYWYLCRDSIFECRRT